MEAVEAVAPERPKVELSDYVLTVIFGVLFFVLMVIWDLVQRLSFYLFGERALHRVDRTLNWLILSLLKITGTSYDIKNPYVFPNTDSYIVIANHQSMFDISLLHEFVWQHTPRFISKQELGNWIPGISFNLRAGGHPLIDRSSGSQAIQQIKDLGERLSREHFAAMIFPEGTRARDGIFKKFRPSGLAALLQAAPQAKIILVALDGSWRFQTYRCWPIPKNTKVRAEVLELFSQSEYSSPEEIVAHCETRLRQVLAGWRGK